MGSVEATQLATSNVSAVVASLVRLGMCAGEQKPVLKVCGTEKLHLDGGICCTLDDSGCETHTHARCHFARNCQGPAFAFDNVR